jgi:23S rRNA pseudouridine2605 synthase
MKNKDRIRISRFLADCGAGSRRKCGDMVKEGRVSVNNAIIRDLSFSVGKNDIVRLDGKKADPDEKLVLALNKPPGYLSTARDDFERKTVMSLAGSTGKRLYPAGRLDLDSRGLIILSNDGDLVYRITHPRFNISKTYEAVLDRRLDDDGFRRINLGVVIDNKVFKPDRMNKNRKTEDGFPLTIRIHEGRKRIIRRAFQKIGYNVVDLKRTMIGNYRLGSLPEGQYRVLDKEGVDRLMMKK